MTHPPEQLAGVYLLPLISYEPYLLIFALYIAIYFVLLPLLNAK